MNTKLASFRPPGAARRQPAANAFGSPGCSRILFHALLLLSGLIQAVSAGPRDALNLVTENVKNCEQRGFQVQSSGGDTMEAGSEKAYQFTVSRGVDYAILIGTDAGPLLTELCTVENNKIFDDATAFNSCTRIFRAPYDGIMKFHMRAGFRNGTANYQVVLMARMSAKAIKDKAKLSPAAP